jgi:hypothetical protein
MSEYMVIKFYLEISKQAFYLYITTQKASSAYPTKHQLSAFYCLSIHLYEDAFVNCFVMAAIR